MSHLVFELKEIPCLFHLVLVIHPLKSISSVKGSMWSNYVSMSYSFIIKDGLCVSRLKEDPSIFVIWS